MKPVAFREARASPPLANGREGEAVYVEIRFLFNERLKTNPAPRINPARPDTLKK
jgi:hypothetical protein